MKHSRSRRLVRVQSMTHVGPASRPRLPRIATRLASYPVPLFARSVLHHNYIYAGNSCTHSVPLAATIYASNHQHTILAYLTCSQQATSNHLELSSRSSAALQMLSNECVVSKLRTQNPVNHFCNCCPAWAIPEPRLGLACHDSHLSLVV